MSASNHWVEKDARTRLSPKTLGYFERLSISNHDELAILF